VLLTILRFRLLIWWRALRSRRGASQRAGWIGGLALLVIGLVAFQFGRVAAGSTQDHTSVLVDIFGLLGLFVVLFGVSVALTELYVASDIDLLLTAPLRPRTLFALKTLDSARAAAGIGALGLCALAGWGVATGASAPFYLAALLITLLFAAGATLFDICLVLLLTRIVPARRLRDVVLLVGSVGGALLWLFFETARRRISSNAFGDLAARLATQPLPRRTSSRCCWPPRCSARPASCSSHASFWPGWTRCARLRPAADGAALGGAARGRRRTARPWRLP
jgi:hypothetical protein